MAAHQNVGYGEGQRKNHVGVTGQCPFQMCIDQCERLYDSHQPKVDM